MDNNLPLVCRAVEHARIALSDAMEVRADGLTISQAGVIFRDLVNLSHRCEKVSNGIMGIERAARVLNIE